MYCKLDDIDDDYISKYYDRNMSMLNTGGMTLVSKEFFEWGKKVVAKARERLTEDLLERDPKHGFAKGKIISLKIGL